MVRRDYGNAISVFEFSPVEGAYGASYVSLQLAPGDAVTITLAGQLALTGRVTTRSVAYDKSSHQVVIAGRSVTSDAVDSSIAVKPGNYNGYTFQQAANAVLAEHNINLIMADAGDAATKTFANLVVHYGETAAEFISRMALQRGLYLTDNAQGNLVASRLGQNTSSGATFTEGQNILRATAKMDNQGVVGSYSGVAQSPGNDQNWPPRAFSSTATATGGLPNLRKLFIVEHPTNSAADLADRVQHEADISTLPEFTVNITVNGWTNPSGQLWDTQQVVSVYSPMLFYGGTTTQQLGIQSITFQQDDQNGSTTTLELKPTRLLSETANSGAAAAPAGGTSPFNTNVNTPTPDKPDYTIST